MATYLMNHVMKNCCERATVTTATNHILYYLENSPVDIQMELCVSQNIQYSKENIVNHYTSLYCLRRRPLLGRAVRILTLTQIEQSDIDDSYYEQAPIKIITNLTDFIEIQTCCICMETDCNSRLIDCSHDFCQTCITEHTKTNDRCPLCRTIISGIEIFENKKEN
jgi:hypothetical protein